jgi:hypothetical protein
LDLLAHKVANLTKLDIARHDQALKISS